MVQLMRMDMTPIAIVFVLTNVNGSDGGNYQNNNTVMIYAYRSYTTEHTPVTCKRVWTIRRSPYVWCTQKADIQCKFIADVFNANLCAFVIFELYRRAYLLNINNFQSQNQTYCWLVTDLYW